MAKSISTIYGSSQYLREIYHPYPKIEKLKIPKKPKNKPILVRYEDRFEFHNASKGHPVWLKEIGFIFDQVWFTTDTLIAFKARRYAHGGLKRFLVHVGALPSSTHDIARSADNGCPVFADLKP